MAARLIKLTAAWGIVSVTLVGVILVQAASPAERAVFGMGLGLIVIWVLIGGASQVRFRDVVRQHVLRIPLNWHAKFVLFCIFMVLLEDAVTVSMTNLASLFGVRYGEAYITASGNYVDVVLFHSVVIFVPMFVAWSWLLARYDFSPAAVLLLFGLTGTLAEAGFGGPQQLVNFGFWVFVYGLMVYLPVYSLTYERRVRPPRWWHFLLGIIVPYASAMLYFFHHIGAGRCS